MAAAIIVAIIIAAAIIVAAIIAAAAIVVITVAITLCLSNFYHYSLANICAAHYCRNDTFYSVFPIILKTNIFLTLHIRPFFQSK